ncbi:HDOD domain-containing protein [Myxococcota bacterium]|nr:HDOD domain-containing protein [Myxococcota bacterium]MBU1382182.1 HDOD domain-containing protein [Myxococcota bacterium]MBU1498728.1 HDOD domain-containing protein [Myxococcota bacterium]
MTEETIDFTEEIKQLPGSVDACTKLRAAITGGNATAAELGELLSQDSILAARVLKLANSPFYGIGKPVTSLKQAVILLGQRLIGHLILSATMNVITTSDILKPPLDADMFWKHSLVSAWLCKKLASESGCESDEAFTMGLLHDIGIFLLILKFKRLYPNVLARFGDSKDGNRSELKMFKTSHCRAAAQLFEKWHIPPEISVSIENHHGDVTSGPMGFLPLIEDWTEILGFPLVPSQGHVSVPKFLKYRNKVYVTDELVIEINEFLEHSR